MLSIEKKFATDLEASKDGVWHRIDEETQIKVAKARNENFKKRAYELFNENKIEMFSRTGKFTDLDERKLMSQLIAETILIDWKGVKDQDGKEVKYTPEIGAQVLANPEMGDFLELVQTCAENEEAYRKAVLEKVGEQAKK
jgi:hypothetical protein